MPAPKDITAAVQDYTAVRDFVNVTIRNQSNLTDQEIAEFKKRLKDDFAQIKEQMEIYPIGSPEREPYMQHLRSLFDIRQKIDALPQAANLAKGHQQDNQKLAQDTVNNSLRREETQKLYTQFKNIMIDAIKRPNDKSVRQRAGRLADKINELIKEYEPIVKEVSRRLYTNQQRIPNNDERAISLLKHMQERIIGVELGRTMQSAKTNSQPEPEATHSKPSMRR